MKNNRQILVRGKSFDFWGVGLEDLKKKIPAASQAKKKIPTLPALRKTNHACVVEPKKKHMYKS